MTKNPLTYIAAVLVITAWLICDIDGENEHLSGVGYAMALGLTKLANLMV